MCLTGGASHVSGTPCRYVCTRASFGDTLVIHDTPALLDYHAFGTSFLARVVLHGRSTYYIVDDAKSDLSQNISSQVTETPCRHETVTGTLLSPNQPTNQPANRPAKPSRSQPLPSEGATKSLRIPTEWACKNRPTSTQAMMQSTLKWPKKSHHK